MKLYCLVILTFCLNLADGIVREYYMDGPSTCGQTIIIYDNIINLAARSPISTPNPPRVCTTYLRSGYTDSYYYIKVEWTATIKDCAFSLTIYEGSTPSGAPIKSFRCLGDQENTGIIEVRNSDITVQLTQASDLFQPHNTFNLRISTFRDPSAPEVSEGTSKLPTGAIIGIVIGLFALIVFCIIMCWFYKQGKLKFLEKKSMQSYRGGGGFSVSGKSENIFHSMNGGSTGYVDSVGESEKSFASKNWDNQNMWASLTNTPTMGRKVKPVTPPVAPPLPSVPKTWESDSQASLKQEPGVQVLSSSPPRGRRRIRNTEEPPRGRRPLASSGSGKGNYNNGYANQEEQENRANAKKETNVDDVFEDDKAAGGGILHELRRELSRRQSMKELKSSESETSSKKPLGSGEGPASESTPRTSRKANGMPEETGTIDRAKYTGIDQQSEVGEPDKITNPLLRTNPAIRASVSSLRSRTDESPGSKRKKRKKKYVGVHRDSSRGKGDNQEHTTDDSMPNTSFDSMPHGHSKQDNGPLPPEALAPVFATDESVMQHFYPPQQDYQNQINEMVLLGYDAYGNAIFCNPHQYQTNGQTYMIDPHGNYIPVADMSYPGLPGYTSTPGHDSYHTPQHNYHQMPSNQLARANINNSSIVPAGTVLDDPQVPPPGGTIIRSAVDKKTGAQVNQTIWTDSKREPTDPPPGEQNPQITRKTIVRVTTKDSKDGQLPSAPDPALQEISFNAAQQLRRHPDDDPPFLSPSKPIRPLMSGGQRTIYSSETPERANAAFYSNIQPPAVMETPKTSVMRDAPVKNHAIRDKITVNRESSEI